MKAKVLMTAMMGFLCLSFISPIAEAGLNECTTNLAVCTANLTNAQTNYALCGTNLATCQTNAQNNLQAFQANLATCQANITTQLGQTVPPPGWYRKLPCNSTSNCPRFEVLADWNNEAVLDKETGLVWEKSPSIEIYWDHAEHHCNELIVGDRYGWRLPTVQELSSIVDPTQINPALPAGHPFSNVQSADYWSATTYAYYPDYDSGVAWGVSFASGVVGWGEKASHRFIYAWCVRGGQGVDPQ